MKAKAAIWWIRRDLRLHDNHALQEAAAQGGRVIPLFILDARLLRSPLHSGSERRQAFLYGGLRALDSDLRSRGGRLIVRPGPPVRVLSEVARESGADTVFAQEDYSPYARRRDAAVAACLPLHLLPGVSVHHPKSVRKADGRPYTAFSHFGRMWKTLPLATASDVIQVPELTGRLPTLPSGELPKLPAPERFPPGEAEARRLLLAFTRGPIFRYAVERDQLGQDGTSALSPYFRFGMISAREAVAVAHGLATSASPDAAGRKGVEAWINELVWREFYMNVLYHFPSVLESAFNPALRNIEWRDDLVQLRAWQQGMTGFPTVDAGMRQLLATGWMHNRARMIVASFLVKDLLINWQEGERWFMRQLVDGDPAANNGGWQWTAGVGMDAAPYFRIFNPLLQSRKFDPQGVYIRRWVPELERVPDRYIHEPRLMPADTQRRVGCIIGKDYPAPMLERAMARERTLTAYKHAAALRRKH